MQTNKQTNRIRIVKYIIYTSFTQMLSGPHSLKLNTEWWWNQQTYTSGYHVFHNLVVFVLKGNFKRHTQQDYCRGDDDVPWCKHHATRIRAVLKRKKKKIKNNDKISIYLYGTKNDYYNYAGGCWVQVSDQLSWLALIHPFYKARAPPPRAVDSGEAKMRTASWENVDKQMPP